MQEKKKSGFGTAGMVLSIVSCSLAFITLIVFMSKPINVEMPLLNILMYIALILGAIGVLFSIVTFITKVKNKKAIVGLILGIITVLMFLFYNDVDKLGNNAMQNAYDEISELY